MAELEAEVTDLGAARARLLKLEERIRKHLGEFCGRPDEVTTVGQILTTVKEKLGRLQKSRAHQAGAATAARDEREALLSAVEERLGPTWAADLDQLAAALGGCEAPPLRAAAVMLSEMRARAAQLDVALAAAVASAADERAVTAELRAQLEKLVAERTELYSRISEARAWAADPDWGDENGLTSPSATASTPSTLPSMPTMEWTTRFNNGRRRVYTDRLVLSLTGIIRQFRLRGNRVAQLCHAVLSMFTGLSDEQLGELAPMPCPTSIKSYVRMRGSLAARWIGNVVINLWGLGVICDAGPGDRIHKFPIFICGVNDSGEGSSLLVAISRISDSGSATEAAAIVVALRSRGINIIHVNALTTDSASSNHGELYNQNLQSELQLAKRAVLIELSEDASSDVFITQTAEPNFGYLLSGLYWHNSTSQYNPMQVVWLPDIPHIGKTDEKYALGAVGALVRIGTGKVVRCLPTSGLFSFARLFASSLEIRDWINHYMREVTMGEYLAMVPGCVVHRLKILPTLASIIANHGDVILDALRIYLIYLKSKARKTTAAHVEEVIADLEDPRYRAWCLFIATQLQFHELLYALPQGNGGFNVSVARSMMAKFILILQTQLDTFEETFADVISAVRDLFDNYAEEDWKELLAVSIKNLNSVVHDDENDMRAAGEVRIVSDGDNNATAVIIPAHIVEDVADELAAPMTAVAAVDSTPAPPTAVAAASPSAPSQPEPATAASLPEPQPAAAAAAAAAAPQPAAAAAPTPASDAPAQPAAAHPPPQFEPGSFQRALARGEKPTRAQAAEMFIADFKTYLWRAVEYLTKRSSAFEAAQLRIASYWDYENGQRYLTADLDLWDSMSLADKAASGLTYGGFFVDPDMLAELRAAADNGPRLALQQAAGSDPPQPHARHNVSLGTKVDAQFDHVFGGMRVHSMDCERALSSDKHQGQTSGKTTSARAFHFQCITNGDFELQRTAAQFRAERIDYGKEGKERRLQARAAARDPNGSVAAIIATLKKVYQAKKDKKQEAALRAQLKAEFKAAEAAEREEYEAERRDAGIEDEQQHMEERLWTPIENATTAAAVENLKVKHLKNEKHSNAQLRALLAERGVDFGDPGAFHPIDKLRRLLAPYVRNVDGSLAMELETDTDRLAAVPGRGAEPVADAARRDVIGAHVARAAALPLGAPPAAAAGPPPEEPAAGAAAEQPLPDRLRARAEQARAEARRHLEVTRAAYASKVAAEQEATRAAAAAAASARVQAQLAARERAQAVAAAEPLSSPPLVGSGRGRKRGAGSGGAPSKKELRYSSGAAAASAPASAPASKRSRASAAVPSGAAAEPSLPSCRREEPVAALARLAAVVHGGGDPQQRLVVRMQAPGDHRPAAPANAAAGDRLSLSDGVCIKYNWSCDPLAPLYYRGEVIDYNAQTDEHEVFFFYNGQTVVMRLNPDFLVQVCTGCSKCSFQGCDACVFNEQM